MDDDRTVDTFDHTDLEQAARSVGADEHRKAVVLIVDEHRMVEGVDHVVVVDAMFASTRRDERRFHDSKLVCRRENCKLTCRLPAPPETAAADPSRRALTGAQSGAGPPIERADPGRLASCTGRVVTSGNSGLTAHHGTGGSANL